MGLDLDYYNPYPAYQPGQKEAICQMLEAFESGQKVVELNAPTASGKSLDLYVLGLVLSKELEMDKVIYSTPLVSLVNQLEKTEEFSKMPVLKGKRNYPCGKIEDVMADECPFKNWYAAIKACKNGDESKPGNPCCNCAYQLDRQRFNASPFGATTFARYIVDPSCHNACATLLIDESAGLEQALVNYSTMKLPEDTDIKNLRAYVVEYAQELSTEVAALEEDIKGQQDDLDLMEKSAKTGTDQENIRQQMKYISKLIKEKNRLEREERKCQKVIYHIDHNHKYMVDSEMQFRLLEGKSEFSRLIEKLDLVILASGTPTSALYAENYSIVKIQHPIPLAQRLVYYCPMGSMNFRDREITAPKIANAIEKLHARYRKKTIVHCAAYGIAKMLYNNLSTEAKQIAILQENPNERELYKEMFMNSDESIFLSIKFSEGLDLKGPDYKMNILAKIPFENIKDEYVAQRNQNDNYLRYNTFAAVDVMQAAGRCTRAPEDFSETWILDESWKGLLNRNRKKFEPWFVAALKDGSI